MKNAEQMNRNMRDLLIEHIDQKPVPIIFCMSVPPAQRDRLASRYQTLLAASRYGYIKFDRHPAPRTSTITDSGRNALAKVLADWADAICRMEGGLDRLLPDVSGEIAEAKELRKLG